MPAREDILAGIRRSLHRGPVSAARAEELRAGLLRPKSGPIPARAAALDHGERITLFAAMATATSATLDRVGTLAAVPQAIADYLVKNNLPTDLAAAPGVAVDWSAAPMLTARQGAARPEDLVSVTPVFAAVAETGTLVLLSGPESPTGLNFLPDTHIAVVFADDVTATYEDVFERMRAERGEDLPRSINLITGPSRTGDIEQTIQLGAHGPRRLHILLVEGKPGQ